MTAKKKKIVNVEKNDYKVFLNKEKDFYAERFYRWTISKLPTL